MKKIFNILLAASIFFTINNLAFAFNGDISISDSPINFSKSVLLEGTTTRIYTSVKNSSQKDLLGTSRFYDNEKQIGGDQPLSIFAGKTDDVFIDWTPGYGDHKITVKIFPWDKDNDNPANNAKTIDVFVAKDTDRDGTSNDKDPDDDNDGVSDTNDEFPLNPGEQYDTDGDGTGNNKDKDDDNDGVPDTFDDLPLNPNENLDTDKDGIGNMSDTDDDNDGLNDTEEENFKTNPLLSDTDGDGVDDKKDKFPLDNKEWADFDNDKLGDNSDTDDDNDGIPDLEDKDPFNKGPSIKTKGIPDSAETYNKVTLDATPSFDEDGQITKYQWIIDGTETYESALLNYAFKNTGLHTIKLTIQDNKGETRTNDYQISVMNITIYKQIIILLVLIGLASVIYFKYISKAKIKGKSVKA